MKQSKTLSSILLMLLFLATGIGSKATHIVGGDVSYVCLGGDRYLVTFSIYRDCIGGLQGAIEMDDPAYITVFYPNGRVLVESTLSAKVTNGEVIPPNFKNDCVSNPPKTCLNKITFENIYTLPGGPSGYKIMYQNCCRNRSVMNLINPGNTGATYYCIIPPSTTAECNSSAQFKNFPPQIICVNNPLIYDHGAIDPDGDSLSYEFCTAYDSPEKNRKTNPSFFHDPVTYRSPYTASNPITGNPNIQIDPKTGMITGTPNLQGRFVVTVCCHEWRDGRIINTVTREFQFVVTNCSKNVIAYIPQYSDEPNTYIVNCENLTVTFDNRSTGGSTYHWDFGVPDTEDDTSNAFSPFFTYPDTGVYKVTLIVNKGTTCTDSISRLVKLYPTLTPNFTFLDKICPGDTVQFQDSSFSTYPISRRLWNFDDDSPLDTNKNPSHVFPYGGLYNVGLMVWNEKGCRDTVFKKILVDPFLPDVGDDTTIVVDEKIQFLGKNEGVYTWTPSRFLSDTNSFNPIGHFTEIGNFVYKVKVVSETGCVGYDTIRIRVIDYPHFSVPNAFTPNGDGKNDFFRPLQVGFSSLRFFKVFNRYGEEIYSTQNLGEGWDGTYKGQNQEMGVYFWMIGAKDRRGKNFDLKGDVTLIR